MIESGNPEIDLAAVQKRVQEQLAVDGARLELPPMPDDRNATGEHAALELPVPPPPAAVPAYHDPRHAVFAPAADGRCSVADLLALRDADFVEAAYRAVLRRDADPAGRNGALARLRAGVPKLDLLWELRYSEEGRRVGAEVGGLPGPRGLHALARMPLLRPLAAWLRELARLPRLATELRRAEARQEQAELEARREAAVQREAAMRAEQSMRAWCESAATSLRASHHALAASTARRFLRHRLYAEEMRKSINRARRELFELREAMREDRRASDEMLKAMVESWHQRIGAVESALAASPPEHELDDFYSAFEERFRGSTEEIRQRQRAHLPAIAAAVAATANAPVVDLGCGRGEWLDLLREAGLEARGVDLNRTFLASARQRGLEVHEQDAVAHLAGLEGESLAAVTAFHIIEHLPLDELVALVDEALRVLKPGGVLLVETPNPANIWVGACTFWIDPTHRKPLPAPLVHALLELRGFAGVEVVPLHRVENPPAIDAGSPDFDHMLRESLYGPRDYAVIGRKPGAPA